MASPMPSMASWRALMASVPSGLEVATDAAPTARTATAAAATTSFMFLITGLSSTAHARALRALRADASLTSR